MSVIEYAAKYKESLLYNRYQAGRDQIAEGQTAAPFAYVVPQDQRDPVAAVEAFAGHIGHGAVLHGCIVRRDALVGMGAVVMDEAEVGEQAIIAACAFVPAGMKLPPRTLSVGAPVKVLRELGADEIARKLEGTLAYQALAQRSRATLVPVTPLAQPEAGRKRLELPAVPGPTAR